MKKEHLQGRDYWYLNLIGRHPERTEPGGCLILDSWHARLTWSGVVRALVDPYFKKAREQGVPLYLEAITEHARDVYAHMGFRTIAEVRLGVGRTNSRGELDENGEGIILYGMMAE